MNRVSRYIIRAAIAPFCFGTVTVIFLFLMQFLMKFLDKLVGKGIDELIILQLIAYNIAWMAILAVPMGVLFASLVAFGNMSANHEITILKASGGSLLRMMIPLLFAAAILTYLLILYNSIVIPETNHRSVVLMYDVQRKKPTFSIEAGQFSDIIEGYTILARQVDNVTNTLKQVTIYDNKNYSINRVINAATCDIRFAADMRKLEFILRNGEIHQSTNNSVKNYRYITFNEYKIGTNAHGFGFEQSDENAIGRSDREMSIDDMQKIVANSQEKLYKEQQKFTKTLQNQLNYLLKATVDEEISNKKSKKSANKVTGATVNQKSNNSSNTSKIQTAPVAKNIRDVMKNIEKASENRIISHTVQSSNSSKKAFSEFIFLLQNSTANITNNKEQINKYEVEIHKKYAIPFACIAFVLIGCPLGIITRGGNFGLSAAITLIFYMVYWACLISGEKLADRALIDPFISMWLGNIVIGIVGIFLTFKANNETLSFSPRIFSKHSKS